MGELLRVLRSSLVLALIEDAKDIASEMELLRGFRSWVSRFVLSRQIPVLRSLRIPDLVAIVKRGDAACRAVVLSSTGDLVHYVFGIGCILQQASVYPCLHTIYWRATRLSEYVPYNLYATTLPKLPINSIHPVYRHISIYVCTRKRSQRYSGECVWLYIPWNPCFSKTPRVFVVSG